MQKSVLIEVVRSLNKQEIRELNKWLQSPSHNQREDSFQLFGFLVKFFSKNDGIPEKELAWKAIYPNESYDDAYMRQIMFFLLKAIEEYLVFTEHKNDAARFQVALAKIYRNRKLEKAYHQSQRNGREQLDKQPLRNTYYLQSKFFFEQEECAWQTSVGKDVPASLNAMSNALDTWYLAEKLQVGNATLILNKVYKGTINDSGLLEVIMEYAKNQSVLQEHAVGMFYYACMIVKQPNEIEYFDRFEELLHKKGEDIFNASELFDLYRTALNYCTAKVNQGMLDFAKRALSLYRKGLQKGILLDNNIVPKHVFGNAVAFALKLQEYDWAEKFIQEYKDKLDEKERNSITNFNLSRLFFEKGEYKTAQRLLTHFEYDDMLLNIIAKTMLLKIYYETDEYDALESLIDSMRIYLQRKESLDANRKASYKNLLSLMKKLLQVNILSRSEREKFRGVVLSTNPLAERDWLLKQLEGRK